MTPLAVAGSAHRGVRTVSETLLPTERFRGTSALDPSEPVPPQVRDGVVTAMRRGPSGPAGRPFGLTATPARPLEVLHRTRDPRIGRQRGVQPWHGRVPRG